MDIKSIHAIRPYVTLSLDQSLTEEQILGAIEKNKGRIFLLPRKPYIEPPKLKPFVDAGAKLLIRKDEVIAPLISKIIRDAYISQFKEKVFMQGYSARSSKSFLNKGASLLIDGDDRFGAMPADSVKDLCNLSTKPKQVKVSHYKFSEVQLKSILSQQVKLVFSCFSDMVCHIPLINTLIQHAAKQIVIAATNFSQQDLLSFLKNGASVVITGFDKLPLNVIRDLALQVPVVSDPAEAPLKILIEMELEQHRPDLEILQTDGRLQIIDNMDWYYSA